MKYREEDVVHITKDFFGSPDPRVFFTRGGSIAVIFTEKGEGNKPLIGAYYSGSEWIACQWTMDGNFIYDEEESHHRAVDLIMTRQVDAPKEAA